MKVKLTWFITQAKEIYSMSLSKTGNREDFHSSLINQVNLIIIIKIEKMHVRLQDLVRERLSKMFIILTIKKEWSFIFNNEERYLLFSGVIGIVKRQLSIRHRWFPIRNFDFFVCVLKDFYMTKGGGGVLKLSALTWGRGRG